MLSLVSYVVTTWLQEINTYFSDIILHRMPLFFLSFSPRFYSHVYSVTDRTVSLVTLQ
jgi:hypothetical protein